MNPLALVIALRTGALVAGIAGQPRTADRFYTLADGVEAGRLTEAHMQLVADKLKSRQITDADWDDVEQRIASDAARLHGSGSG